MKRYLVPIALLCMAFPSACGEEVQTSVSTEQDDAMGQPAVTPAADADAQIPAADVATPGEDVAAPSQSRTHRLLVDMLALPWEVSDGVARGFDLDDHVSDGTAPEDCGWDDYTSPDGAQGIDNQMARLTPLFEPAGLGQAFEYLENSIEDSGFFHLFELRNVDSLVDDDDIELIYELGGGTGLMDPQGDLVAHQTMCVQNDSPHVVATSASIKGGVLHARFDEVTFLFSMFERVYPFVFEDMHVTGRMTAEGFLDDGVLGGTLAMSNLLALVVKGAQNTGGLLEPMQLLLDGLGDMPTEEGPCTALSSALDFSAVPVFFYPDDSDCDPCGNDTCEYFESCETCLIDCCAGCGNGVCDAYPITEHTVTVTESGFTPEGLDMLVGDTVVWTNGTGEPMNLVCDELFKVESVAAGETMLRVATASGSFTCRIYEQPGRTNLLTVDDNHSENCQSCPDDCGECE